MNKTDLLSEGKTKKIYNTKNNFEVIIHYKDNITSFNGKKNELISYKGVLNNEINSCIFKFLNSCGIKTHFIKKINKREQLCHKLKMIPIEFVVRNFICGSLSKRLKIKEGTKITNQITEIFYKNDKLKDPFINDNHAVFLGISSYNELNIIYKIINNINNYLNKYFYKKNIILADFKVEFGKNYKNEIFLSDEISPDTCRLWDKITMKKLDKDPFRKNMINKKEILNIYTEVLERLNKE